jgi:hypothetical protein
MDYSITWLLYFLLFYKQNKFYRAKQIASFQPAILSTHTRFLVESYLQIMQSSGDFIAQQTWTEPFRRKVNLEKK